MATITIVDHGKVGPVAGKDFHLFQRRMANVLPSQRLPQNLRMPTTKPSSSVVAMLSLQPNAYRAIALPFDIQSTSGLCNA